MRGNYPSQVTFGPFRLDRPNRRLQRGVSVIPLRPKAFAVLDYLVARAGRLVTKDQLLAAVWPDTAVTDTVLKVNLTPINDESFVPQAVATALGVREQPGQRLTQTLVRFLATREVLLVVDNCEHVIGATASLLQDLLQAAPRTTVLATSREPLRIDGERIWLVPPLSLPESQDALPPDTAFGYSRMPL